MDAPRKGPTLNAAPADQLRLLDVAGLDARLDQLAHRRRTLPEHAEIDAADQPPGALRDRLVGRARPRPSDIARELTKAEKDVEQVRAARRPRPERLDSGAVTSPKDLENLQHEIASLAKRQSDLEDVELEVMERQEDVRPRARRAAPTRRLTPRRAARAPTQRRDAAFAELDAEVAGFVTEGRGLAGGQLVARRCSSSTRSSATKQGGVGAAALRQRPVRRLPARAQHHRAQRDPGRRRRTWSCAARTAARILVRTAESGL